MSFNQVAKVAIAAAVLTVSGSSSASAFTQGNLVVMRVDNTNPAGGNAFFLDEYTRAGTSVGNTIAIDSSAATGATLPGTIDNDRHLHRSPNGQFLTFVGYGSAAGAVNPSTLAAASTPRVVGIVSPDGTVDTTTRLTDSYDLTAIRGAVTSDGTSIWLGGDNSGGVTTTGGTRYTTRGASTAANLSAQQTPGQAVTPDNIRDVSIFTKSNQLQLWNTSGSSASVGKGVHQVGTGLPTSGSQPVSLWTADSNNATSLYQLDTNNDSTAETMYIVASNPTTIRKFVFSGSAWTASGAISFTNANQVLATLNNDGSATVWAGSPTQIVSFTDPAPSTGSISSLTLSPFLSAPSGYTLGGIEFAPVPEPTAASAIATGLLLLARRRKH